MNVDRYITEDAVRSGDAAWVQWFADGPHAEDPTGTAAMLRAALPGILARHRADVLRQSRNRCVGCSWCCQGTPPLIRGEGHEGCQ